MTNGFNIFLLHFEAIIVHIGQWIIILRSRFSVHKKVFQKFNFRSNDQMASTRQSILGNFDVFRYYSSYWNLMKSPKCFKFRTAH